MCYFLSRFKCAAAFLELNSSKRGSWHKQDFILEDIASRECTSHLDPNAGIALPFTIRPWCRLGITLSAPRRRQRGSRAYIYLHPVERPTGQPDSCTHYWTIRSFPKKRSRSFARQVLSPHPREMREILRAESFVNDRFTGTTRG